MDEHSTYFPTTSSSLSLHYSARVLWLPLQCCLRMANGSSLTSISGRQSSARSTLTYGTATTFYDEEEAYGFEINLKKYMRNHNRVDVRGSEAVARQAHLHLFIGSQLSASQWQNMDNFQATRAVIIVLNCAALPCPLQDALFYVKSVFDATFNHLTCRCVVLNPSTDIQSYTKTDSFVSVSSSDSIESIGCRLIKSIGESIVTSLTRKIQTIESPSSSSMLSFRTPVDKVNTSGISKHLISSRYAKIKGDLLLQLGAVDHALEAYGSTYFSSKVDPLWRSATLESIAAARCLRLRAFLDEVPHLKQAIAMLQSDSTAWDESIRKELTIFEESLKVVYDEFRKDLKLFKKSAIPTSLYLHLRHEVQEGLSDCLRLFSSTLTRMRLTSGTDMTLSRQLREAVQRYIGLIEEGINCFLQESLSQLKIAGPMFHVSLAERELDAHLKWTYFLSHSSSKSMFISELGITLKLAHACRREEVIRRVMMYCVFLSKKKGCLRLAVSLLVQVAVWEKDRQCYPLSMEALALAGTICGLQIPGLSQLVCAPPFLEKIMNEKKCIGADTLSKFAHDPSKPGSSVSEKSLSSNSMFEVWLLQELVRSIDRAGIRVGIMCRIANYVLFEYHGLLSCDEQQELLRFSEVDASNVPYMVIKEVVVPFVTSCDPQVLPPRLCPKTVPICGPLFTYIDTQRLQLTVLSLNGRKLDTSVIWVTDDVGTVVVSLTNPLYFKMKFRSLALMCSSAPAVTVNSSHPEALSYTVEDVELQPGEKRYISLAVVPQSEGTINLVGIQAQLHYMGSTIFQIPLPNPISIPVLQKLPVLSCSTDLVNVTLFPGQHLAFGFTAVNTGSVPIPKINVSVHNDSCQLEDCKGCCEKSSKKDGYVRLDKEILNKMPLQVGETITVPGVLFAPEHISMFASQLLIFRIDYALDFPELQPPPGIPREIPVFGVVPKRVLEVPCVFSLEAGVIVRNIELSTNKKYLSIRIANLNAKYSISILLHAIPALGTEDVVLSPSSEYTISHVEVAAVLEKTENHQCLLPWMSDCPARTSGSVVLNFSILKSLRATLHDLHECCILAVINPGGSDVFTWCSNAENSNGMLLINDKNPFCATCRPFSPVAIELTISAPWSVRRRVWMKVGCSCSADLGTVAGPVDTCIELGNSKIHRATLEFIPFISGNRALDIVLGDAAGKSVHYQINFRVHS